MEIVGIRFKDIGKIYYFSPDGKKYETGTNVIVETSRGEDYGEVVIANREIEPDKHHEPLKRVLRVANKKDNQRLCDNIKSAKIAFMVFEDRVKQQKLPMKPSHAEYSFDGTKIIFYFTADNRVDFRELVKDLAGTYHVRIELRQIGVRDIAKSLSGIGVCGRKFCCSSFLGDFQPISIKIAKDQDITLNPMKISGCCGQLMCCLKYEQDVYDELIKITPGIGAVVSTPDGKGTVTSVNLISGNLHVALDKKTQSKEPETTVIVRRDKVTLVKKAPEKSADPMSPALKKLDKAK
jgi:cell fate regulator YaaT (PSP1 superfamily)